MPAFTPEAMRARFVEACAERDAVIEAAQPLRDQRDAIKEQMAPLEAQERHLNTMIRAAETGLFDLQNEIGSLVRALNGKTSAPVESAAAAPDEGGPR